MQLALALSGLIAFPAYAHLPIPPKKGEIGRKVGQTPVADFTLIDQDGKPFRLSSARGKWVLTTFIFTTCPDVCPLLTAKFAAIQRALRDQKQDNYLLLSITTDPERDTPSALKTYAEGYKADFRHWLFLTGSRDRLTTVWKNFGVNVSKSAGGQVRHTALTTLIDRQGNRRVDYYTDKWEEKEILKDISWLDAHGKK
ncbi:MAG: SCO family protein [Candidatus Binatia bacterium]